MGRGWCGKPTRRAKSPADNDRIVPRSDRQQVIEPHLTAKSQLRDDCIVGTGGAQSKTATRKIVVMRGHGNSVVAHHSLFRRGGSVPMHPGEAIVVPIRVDSFPKLRLWQYVTQTACNLAVGLPAI